LGKGGLEGSEERIKRAEEKLLRMLYDNGGWLGFIDMELPEGGYVHAKEILCDILRLDNIRELSRVFGRLMRKKIIWVGLGYGYSLLIKFTREYCRRTGFQMQPVTPPPIVEARKPIGIRIIRGGVE